MRIAHLIPQFYPHIGGAEICIHNVCGTLAGKGHKAMVITTTPPPERKPELPYKIEYLWSKTCGLFRRLPYFCGRAYLNYALASLQKKHQFDLWQVTNGWPLGVFAVDFLKKNNVPCILRCCGDDIQKFPEINYGMRLNPQIDSLVKVKFPLFDGFVALTPSVSEEYIKLGIPENRIRIIPNGVDTAKFASFDMKRKCEVRKALGISNEKIPLILTVGRYHPKKGFNLIPGIAQKLRALGLDFNWVIAGRNVCKIRNNHPECESLGLIFVDKFAKSGGKQDDFNLPSQELIDLYCSADLFALPTLIETFGMVLVEAMAAGLPIVTTDAPGVRDVIEEGTEGFKVPSGDIGAFAEKTAELLSKTELKQKISEKSLGSSKKYDWGNISEQYLNFYKDILDRLKL